MNLWNIFLTGLFTGGLTCLAVQGGLLASTIAQRQNEELQENTTKTGNVVPISLFLISKLIAYTLLGFLLGIFGSFFQFSLFTRAVLMIAVSVFMIGSALNMLEVHPIFRYFVIQPPRFLTKLVRTQSKSKDAFAPILLGAFTVFIPCGTTQAMMALAIASGSPITAATIMFVFILGTSPLFFILGYLAKSLGFAFQQKFSVIAALLLIATAVYNIDGALALSGSVVTLRSLTRNVFCTISFCDNTANAQVAGAAVEEATITFKKSGYTPADITVRAGSKVTLNLVNQDGRGCIQAFTIPKLSIQKIVPFGSTEEVSFTAPSQPGELKYVCSMGMFEGRIHVVKPVSA